MLKEKSRNFSLFPLNPIKVYYLGLLFGDGAIGKESKKYIELGMCDKDIIDNINKQIFNDQLYIRQRILPSGKIFYKLISYSYNLWHEMVEKFGLVNRKSAIIKYPAYLDKSLYSHFVRGLLDSDGCFSISNNRLQFSYGSTSYDFIYQLRDGLVDNVGVNSVVINTLKKGRKNNMYTIQWHGQAAPVKIGEWIYSLSDENSRGNRKFSIWNNYKKSQSYISFINRPKLSPADVIDLHKSKFSVGQICAALNISTPFVYGVLYKNNLKPNTIITRFNINKVKEQIKDCKTIKELSEKYNYKYSGLKIFCRTNEIKINKDRQ